MKRCLLPAGCVLLVCWCGCATVPTSPASAPGPRLKQTIALEGVGAPRQTVGVPGRLDHLAYDPNTQRLFVAALENGSLEVIDVVRGERVASITGLGHPQGIAIVPQAGCAAVACGGGTLYVYNTQTLAEVARTNLGPGADNVRYDARGDALYVSRGDTKGGVIAVLNTRTWELVRELQFSSRPESFQLDPHGPRLFANVPEGIRATKYGLVAIMNRDIGQQLDEITLAGRARNFPMAFDAEHNRLFTVCRRPAVLIAIDAGRRAVIAEAPCTEDSDDVAYDARTGRVYVIGGGFRPDMQEPPATQASGVDETGAIDVFAVGAGGELKLVARTPTAPHARTGLFVADRRMIYVAVPPREGRPAEIRGYRVD
jgi:hypothetical protein